MDKINLSFNELIEGFSDWMKSIDRSTIILYAIHEDKLIIVFKFDFYFVCVITAEDLQNYYKNPDIDYQGYIQMFFQEYLYTKAVEVDSIKKYMYN